MENTVSWIAPEFYRSYIERAGEDDLLTALENNFEESLIVFQIISEDKAKYAYNEDKWTVLELIQHLIDTERVFAYRSMRIARGDQTEMPGFEQDDYVPSSKANERELVDVLREFKILRKSTIELFKSFPSDSFSNTGFANGGEFNLEGLGRALVGHTRHHLRILERRYL